MMRLRKTAASARSQPFEPDLEVGHQVLEVFQPRVDPEAGSLMWPLRGTARLARIEGHDQALEPAPGRADSVEFQAVDHRAERDVGDALFEHYAEESAGAADRDRRRPGPQSGRARGSSASTSARLPSYR